MEKLLLGKSMARGKAAAQFFVYEHKKKGVGFGMDILSIVVTVLVRFALIMGAIGAWQFLWRIVRWLIKDF